MPNTAIFGYGKLRSWDRIIPEKNEINQGYTSFLHEYTRYIFKIHSRKIKTNF